MGISKDCDYSVCADCGDAFSPPAECGCSPPPPIQPLWYVLSDMADFVPDLPQDIWQEVMALSQMMHDLSIDDTDKLMRRLGAIYLEDPELQDGKYCWGMEKYDSNRMMMDWKKEIGEPIQSNRRKAIMAQRKAKEGK